ncbi:exosome complex RNA-binding protein Csl4 [Methanothermobacter sp. K4]|uniref:exosome complex RNA-binding protein Csl4 n=1 Tax=Methanothermobacter sp. K4 TaxID=2913262 RepID=UPI001EDB2761|nr:exosome complex RNA-binding protein Csl4 [Methanothermobacter sp. K4]MCG2828034.1 exosome complex RNA-binding protein Csl4 [Methanothermobacter sp. K4]
MKVKSGDIVFPGDFLAVSEEVIPSEGTYDDDGEIKSLVVGEVARDDRNKSIKVISKFSTPPILRTGSRVIGEVIDVRGQRALVRIHSIKGNRRALATYFVGGVHVSQAKKGYLSKLTEAFRIGDIVEARVTKVMGLDGIDLQTSSRDLGVIKAMCTRCRHFMEMNGKDEVKCPNCENREKRKLSANYEG